ncbi:hypothetical protein BD779DRAFT_1476503 [Infundibulicybe gibba]|nr:hypothetical protein BD779DRAFT_1476503 [Infundibulicybe gibba]
MERGLNRNYLRNMILIRSNRSHEYSTTLGDTGQAQQGTSRDVQMALGPGHSTGKPSGRLWSVSMVPATNHSPPSRMPTNTGMSIVGRLIPIRRWFPAIPVNGYFEATVAKHPTVISACIRPCPPDHLSSTALAALTNAGDSWELLGREGLEQAEQEVLRSA